MIGLLKRISRIWKRTPHSVAESEERCSADGCTNAVKARGLCSRHYRRYMKYGTPHEPDRRLKEKKKCSIDGCDRWAKARGLCSAHWSRWKRWGDPTHRLKPLEWTPEEDAMVMAAHPTPHPDRRAAASGETDLERIARTLGRTYSGVTSRRSKLQRG